MKIDINNDIAMEIMKQAAISGLTIEEYIQKLAQAPQKTKTTKKKIDYRSKILELLKLSSSLLERIKDDKNFRDLIKGRQRMLLFYDNKWPEIMLMLPDDSSGQIIGKKSTVFQFNGWEDFYHRTQALLNGAQPIDVDKYKPKKDESNKEPDIIFNDSFHPSEGGKNG